MRGREWGQVSAELQVKVSAGLSGSSGRAGQGQHHWVGLGRACYSSPLAQPLLMVLPCLLYSFLIF